MPNRHTLAALGIALVAIVGGIIALIVGIGKGSDKLEDQKSGVLAQAREDMKAHSVGAKGDLSDTDFQDIIDNNPDAEFANLLLNRLLKLFLANKGAIRGEATLKFKSAEAMEKFLAGNLGSGFRILGRSDKLGALRIGFDKAQDLWDALSRSGMSQADMEIGANYAVSYPSVPNPSTPPNEIPPQNDAESFGYNLLDHLGVPRENAEFGAGVKVAVIDGLMQAHPSLLGKITTFDLLGTAIAADDGHATAVGSIIAGSGDVPGIAPGVSIDNYRVLDGLGNGDSFTLAEAIISAVDGGNKVINISLGSYGDSQILADAVAYASNYGVLVVAAAGNDGLNTITYPAAYPSVVSIGAYEAKGEHLNFSNGGEGLSAAAPGYGIPAAWPGETGAVGFSGTSASAPVYTAAVASVMTQFNVSAVQANEMLIQYANEAGAPGVDAYHGAGNVNLYRVFNGNTPGVTDVAVAGNYLDMSNVQYGGAPIMKVTVENRGTDTIYNSQISLKSGTQLENYSLNQLAPGATYTYSIPINLNNVNAEGYLNVSTGIDLSGGQQDTRFNDNRLNSVIPVSVGK